MKDAALNQYFAESVSWESDRVTRSLRVAKIAWWVAGAGWSCAVLTALALAAALPLKTIQPYVIRVDNSTGIVDVVPSYEGHAELGDTVARFLLTHYVTVCEGFNYASAERDYAECGAFNSAKRNQEWYALWNPVNPSSPLNAYRDGTTVRAQVTSVSFFPRPGGGSEIAQVRYVKARRLPGATEVLAHWIATIEYGYASPSKDPQVRQFNPLGFRVLEFHTESETGESGNRSGGAK